MGRRKVGFLEYWNLLAPKLREDRLTQKELMRRLNNARVALKHHGTRPSKSDVDAYRASVTTFFEENTPIVFGISFSSVSLIELVQCEGAKNSLIKAEEMLKESKVDDALDKVAVSFIQLIDDYEKRKSDAFGRSPFFFQF